METNLNKENEINRSGDTLYAYMTNISGNLDPILGLFKKGSVPDFHYEEILALVANYEQYVDGQHRCLKSTRSLS